MRSPRDIQREVEDIEAKLKSSPHPYYLSAWFSLSGNVFEVSACNDRLGLTATSVEYKQPALRHRTDIPEQGWIYEIPEVLTSDIEQSLTGLVNELVKRLEAIHEVSHQHGLSKRLYGHAYSKMQNPSLSFTKEFVGRIAAIGCEFSFEFTCLK